MKPVGMKIRLPTAMPLPDAFKIKTPEEIRHELRGHPEPVIAAVLRLHSGGTFADVEAMTPGLISYHRLSGAPPLPEPLPLEHRLREDIGLDSLALSEMACKLDEIFAVPIETREVASVLTVQDLQNFMCSKLGL